VQPPPQPLPDPTQPAAAQERVDLRPRWPLTGAKHPGSMSITLKSMKSPARQATSLTDVTQAELAALQQQQQEEAEEQKQQQLVGR
jgi:hypothetical protein